MARLSRMPHIVLASRSRARAALLCGAGYRFTQVVSDMPEPAPTHGEALAPYVRRLARLKAEAVAKRFPEDWVIGADTALMLDGRIIGKPQHVRDAVAMLVTLAGRTHRICSAVCVVAPRGRTGRRTSSTAVSSALVTLRKWSESRIRLHVAATKPIHWAGAYAVQDPVSSSIVARIRGDLATVIGLPLEELQRILDVEAPPL